MILVERPNIILRDILPEDVDAFLSWQTSGEWRFLDAPWEGICHSLSPEQEKAFRERFLEARQQRLPSPRARAVIALPDNTPIGYVNRYGSDRFPDVYYLGINISEDNFLNQGLGTIALQAWRDYLFGNSEAHKLEVHTWSFNPRMVRVAEKLGFRHEGTEREMIEWEGERLDMLRFGMLREEWVSLAGGK